MPTIPTAPHPDLWYYRPGHLKIKLSPHEVNISPLEHDAFISKDIGGQRFEGLVPTHSLGENQSWVPAAYAGKTEGKVILYLPTSNEGRPTWVIPETELDAILVK